MAWVSVHDAVDGPKLRDLRKRLKCSKFEALGILNFLWFWGLKNATKEGHIKNADKEEISRYLFGVGSGCKLNTNDIVEALFETGWLDAVGSDYYIHDWETWQEQWYKAIQRRENDSQRKRESRRKQSLPKTEDEDLSADNLADGPPDTSGEGEQGARKKTDYSVGFVAFWDAYPRKVDKGNAYKKYKARLNDGFSEEDLLTAAKNYAAECKKKKTETEYIKHPKTFLSDAMPFQDYLDKDTTVKQKPEQVGGNPFKEYGGAKC